MWIDANSDQATHLEANTCLQALIHTKWEFCFFLQSWHQLKKLLERTLRFWPIFTWCVTQFMQIYSIDIYHPNVAAKIKNTFLLLPSFAEPLCIGACCLLLADRSGTGVVFCIQRCSSACFGWIFSPENSCSLDIFLFFGPLSVNTRDGC